MRLIQFLDDRSTLRVGRVAEDGTTVFVIEGYSSTYELAMAAISAATTLDSMVRAASRSLKVSYAKLLARGRLQPPLTHPDPTHCHVSGSDFTHFGFAAARRRSSHELNAHDAASAASSASMRIFRRGIEAGRPPIGQVGAQPEWFYKGNGRIVVASGKPVVAPEFGLGFGEAPELVGLYIIGLNGRPVRLGFAIGNEFSDHVTASCNELYRAHSKLRQCAVGPELRTGVLPTQLAGCSRIRRNGCILVENAFATGEENMCHSLANVEFHHFKYAAHRVPGDVHVHFLGSSINGSAESIRLEPGDRFEIELPALGAPLVNTLAISRRGFAPGGVQTL
jgi:hypothetical protein